jgi:hypothetical protein
MALFFLGYMSLCHGFIFFLVICEGVMALFSSWLYVSDTLIYNQEKNKAMTPSHIIRKKIKR